VSIPWNVLTKYYLLGAARMMTAKVGYTSDLLFINIWLKKEGISN